MLMGVPTRMLFISVISAAAVKQQTVDPWKLELIIISEDVRSTVGQPRAQTEAERLVGNAPNRAPVQLLRKSLQAS